MWLNGKDLNKLALVNDDDGDVANVPMMVKLVYFILKVETLTFAMLTLHNHNITNTFSRYNYHGATTNPIKPFPQN